MAPPSGSAHALRDVTLDDKYQLESGRVYVTGVQALVRLLMLQRQRDVLAGLNTAGFVSGYRGSPLGALDLSLWGAEKFLSKAHIQFRPGLNEDLAATAIWGYVLLDRSATFVPELRTAVLVIGLVAAVLIIAVSRASRKAVLTIAAVALMAVLAGPAAYTFNTVATAHTGAIPSAGPAVAAGNGPGGGGLTGGGGRIGPPAGGGLGGGFGGGLRGPNSAFGGGGTPGRVGGAGGFLDSTNPAADLVRLLQADASRFTWVAATARANSAAGYELATGDPVMAIGGFNGTDPAPTLAQFQQYVRDGKIHYFIGGGSGPASAGTSSSTASQISAWVQQNFTATTVGGITVYDLTTPIAA